MEAAEILQDQKSDNELFATAIKLDDFSEVNKWVEERLKASLAESMSRTILAPVVFPPGASAKFQRDPAVIAHVISRRGAVPIQQCEGEEVFVPTFQIATHPTINEMNISIDSIRQSVDMATTGIAREELTNVLNALIACADNYGNNVITTPSNVLRIDVLEEAFAKLAANDVYPHFIIMNPSVWIRLNASLDRFNHTNIPQAFKTKQYGDVDGVQILVTSRLDANTILVTGSPESVGSVVIPTLSNGSNITVRTANDPQKLRKGWVIAETIGIVVMADYTVAKIELNVENICIKEVEPQDKPKQPSLLKRLWDRIVAFCRRIKKRTR